MKYFKKLDTISSVFTVFDKLNQKYLKKLDDLVNKLESLNDYKERPSIVKNYNQIMNFGFQKIVEYFTEIKIKFREIIE